MEVPQILLIGSQEVPDKHGLAGRIIGRPLDDSSAPSWPWSISNKYYTANVLLELADLEVGGPHAAAAREAVLLVFDAAQPQTFSSLREWWEGQQAEADPGVKLAVATSVDRLAGGGGGAGQEQQWLLDAQQWCAEQLIEYVEVGAAAAVPQPGSSQLAAQSEEAEGVQRIVEALHAHTWPGLRLKPRGGGGAETQSTAPPVATAAEGAAAQPQQGGSTAAAPAAPAGAGLDLGEEQAEELDMLFAELAGARDRLQLLGDTERREAATALMLRLMGSLGLDEDGGDEADDSEAEDEGGEKLSAAEE